MGMTDNQFKAYNRALLSIVEEACGEIEKDDKITRLEILRNLLRAALED